MVKFMKIAKIGYYKSQVQAVTRRKSVKMNIICDCGEKRENIYFQLMNFGVASGVISDAPETWDTVSAREKDDRRFRRQWFI